MNIKANELENLDQAAAYINILMGALQDAVNEKPRWIPIEERLPESNDDLYLATDGHRVDTYYYCNDGFYFIAPLIEDEEDDDRIFCNEIVAWMPLPEPYNKEE